LILEIQTQGGEEEYYMLTMEIICILVRQLQKECV
jgi:hypothetical protein